jgi:acetyltransferase
MVREIKGFKLLEGFRGKPPSDIAALEKAMVRLSDMAVAHPEIKELDINPMLAHPEGDGATVADCRIILERPEAEA